MANRTRPLLMHRLRVTMLGVVTDVWRDLWVDGSLPLRDLSGAISAAFARGNGEYRGYESRHLFADRAPALPLPGGDEIGGDDNPTDNPWFSGWRTDRTYGEYGGRQHSAPRRWGDRWTMIQCRDPDVIDDAAVTVGETLNAQHPLFFSVATDKTWWFRIESNGLEMRPPDAARIMLEAGHGRAPLAICPDAATWNSWMLAAANPDHEAHAETAGLLDRAVGPWATFDPAAFDADGVREAVSNIGTATRRTRGAWYDNRDLGPLDRLFDSLPVDAHAGLRNHLVDRRVRVPSSVTATEAAAQVGAYCRVIADATVDGLAPDAVASDTLVIAAARRMGLLYSRKGRLRATNRARDAARDPLALRALMAYQLLRRRAHEHPLATLLVLAIADGSISDRERAFAIAAEAATACRSLEGYGRFDTLDDWLGIGRPTSTPASTDKEVERSFATLAETLATLGLERAADSTFVASPALVQFARDALR